MKKSEGLDLLNILKYTMVVVFIVYIVILLNAQGGTKTPMETVRKNILKVMPVEGMKEGTTQDLKKYYGLNAGDYAGVMLYIPDDVMSANELLVVKLKDKEQQQIVEEAATKRRDTQLESFEGYGARQTKLIKSAILDSRGSYVLLAVSKDADKIYEAFRKSL